jgi:hypothetical protein
MHPIISYQLAHASMADLRDQAQRDTLAAATGRLGRRRAGQHPRAMRGSAAVPGSAHAAHPAVAADAPAR